MTTQKRILHKKLTRPLRLWNDFVSSRPEALSHSRNNTSHYHGKRLSLKHKYVGANGNIQNARYSGDWLQVDATSIVSERGHYLVRTPRQMWELGLSHNPQKLCVPSALLSLFILVHHIQMLLNVLLIQVHGKINHRIKATGYGDPIRILGYTVIFFFRLHW